MIAGKRTAAWSCPLDRHRARTKRHRALSILAAGARRSRARPARRNHQSLGLLRFLLSHSRRRGLPRAALAANRHQRAARRGLAQHGTRSGAGRVSEEADRSLSSPRHSGLCVARAAARQRKILGRSSRMARKDRRRAGRAARLAQADEPAKSGLPQSSRAGNRRLAQPLRLGRRQRGGTIFRIARRREQPGAFHADERRCAARFRAHRRLRSEAAL